MMKYLIALLLAILIVSACTPEDTPSASVAYVLGDVIYQNSFDDPNSWESFGFMDTQFGIADGVYNAISSGGGYIPVTNRETHSNVVIEAQTALISGSAETVYGIICRAQSANTSVGYYFLIDGAGQFGIRIGEGNRIRVFVPWTRHPAVNAGIAENTLRAVCIDDYFALYINGQFVAENRQDWLTEGQMGLVVSAPDGVGISAQFDNVTIWSAELAGPSDEG
ncbi:MAG: hypothetical protein ACFE0Q_11195 [Anaerolineae bacterium]